MVDQIKNINDLKDFIYNRFSNNKFKLEYADQQKSIKRLDVEMSISCSSRCLNNYHNTNLNETERHCLTNCARSFYDTIGLFSTLYDQKL